MNEVIKKLASDAGFFVYDDDPTPADPDFISWEMSYSDQHLIEYTNLVVQECAAVIRNAVDHRVPASEYADIVLNHFSSRQ